MLQTFNFRSKSRFESQVRRLVGQRLSWLQQIKVRGIGSPRLLYLNGIDEFDTLTLANQQLNYVQFERREKGIILFFFKGGSQTAACLPFAELAKVELTIYRVKTTLRGQVRINQAGIVKIWIDGQRIELKLMATYFEAGYQYFLTHIPLEKMITHCSTEPPIDENSDGLPDVGIWFQLLRAFVHV